eukprot:CAMPEP_0168615270 /NCGR_PEP_ID=MMETSP0449_2-20121227/4417_1 /TAXON_ID=1082188 /ORGANISM="Strombidium rassoulzadegani, Strain ras09" /LENGTH=93 /DNA_ID=CAMNT_0008656003 /DNA_START=1091 /DNA_END=1372 /DNA_ORIENTATION=+
MSQAERTACIDLEKDEDAHKKRTLAIGVIQSAYKLRLYLRWNQYPNKMKQIEMANEFKERARLFRMQRRRMISKTFEQGRDELLTRLKHSLKN